MTAPTTTLTDRYVWAAARNMPEAQRAEFGRELRERIGDEVDARLADGRRRPTPSAPCSSSSATPPRSPPSYVDRPLQLIGPRYFLAWKRLLTLLYAIVLPIAGGGLLSPSCWSGAAVASRRERRLDRCSRSSCTSRSGSRSCSRSSSGRRAHRAPPPWTPEQLPEVPELSRPEPARRPHRLARVPRPCSPS